MFDRSTASSSISLEWLEPCPRPYAEVLEAWRTSVWEEAIDGGYVVRGMATSTGALVSLRPSGQARRRAHRLSSSPA